MKKIKRVKRLACLLLVGISCVSLPGCSVLGEVLQIREIETAAEDSIGILPSGITMESDVTEETMDVPTTDPYFGVDISFLAMGDNLIHPNIYMDAKKRGTAEKEYDFLPIYSDMADVIAQADLAFINQETLMAGEGYGYTGWPSFNSPQQLGIDLATLGFDLINIANNHMIDKGTSSLVSTVEFWSTQPITLLGAAYDPTPVIIEQDGIKIGLLAYTEHTNGISQTATAEIKVPYINDQRILSDIQNLRDRDADMIIVSIHWGEENTYTPGKEQKRLAQLMADQGVDVILGHHSHCLQPIEWISGANGGKTLCFYSLGNCISGMARPMNQVGGIFTFSIRTDGMGGVVIEDPMITPTVFYYDMNHFNTKLYYLEDFTEEMAASHGVFSHGYSMTAAAARQIVLDVIAPEFLPDWLKNQ